MWRWFAVLGGSMAVDALWTAYIMTASSGQALAAAVCSSLIFGAGAFVTMSYLKDRRYLVPAMLGAFIGTYLMVHLGVG